MSAADTTDVGYMTYEERARCIAERRLARVLWDDDFISLIHAGSFRVIRNPVPKGAAVIDVRMVDLFPHVGGFARGIEFTLVHRDYDPVPEGAEPPRLDPLVAEHVKAEN